MRYINFVAQLVLAFLFTAMLVVGAMQVFNRFFLNISLSWSEEFQKFAFVWLVFIAIPLGYLRNAHLCVDVIVSLFPNILRRTIALIIDLMWLALGIAFVVLTWRLMQVAQYQQSAGLGISMAWVYGGMALGGAYLALAAVTRVVDTLRGKVSP